MPDQPPAARLQAAARDHLLLHFGQHANLRNGQGVFLPDRAEGVYVHDAAGKRYIDGLSALFCAQLGYSYGPEFAKTAERQLNRLPFSTLWNTAHPAAIELAERLAALAPGGLNRVFFTSGGSESVESAWKLARMYHVAQGRPQRTKAIARRTAYHGQTMGALALTGIPALKEPFGAPAFEVTHVPNTNRYRTTDADEDAFTRRLLAETEAAVLEAGPERVAMLIAGPVQNAGGCFTPTVGYWAGLRAMADRYGFLLVTDEVITGFGRIGEYFAVSKYGAVPDMITTAKGLTSSYATLGAVLVSDKVAEPFYEDGVTLLHGLTFAGHPVAAATALTNLDIFERDGVLDNVRSLTGHLQKRLTELTELSIVGDLRGDGFFRALELVDGPDGRRFDTDRKNELVKKFLPARMRDLGLLARADDRGDPVVQIAPPLIATQEELDHIVDLLGQALTDADRHFLDGR
ncbi:aspartate aminotransferase family protein [Streptomyces ipomoeae]|uniref:aspartate aminotransferase family protein n=1 Tax=Streptomyces ipomoeae TaxID=103232 RepID=UPI001147683D|nr:aspartate aminotransferase family protein [Streptomyces ipomoeae]MDX2931491.1 aspartate aminotransferase family protein [Streptomyces ipomoeae]TQE22632.1 aspartate aminotransferase family protein [Streptomyces ipomoeae]